MNETKAFTISKRPDGVAVVSMDVKGEPVNTLKEAFADEVNNVFDALGEDSEVRAVVLASGKKDSFIAGADITMLDQVKSAEQGEQISKDGHRTMDRIAKFPKPVVAAIHGVALGGGLEVALACHARVVTDDKKTKLGLPECQLGLLPGGGGTQRLPRLIGVQPALDMLLTGKQVNAKKARRFGLADEVVHRSILIETAAAMALQRIGRKPAEKGLLDTLQDKEALTEFALAGNPIGRKILFEQARKQLHINHTRQLPSSRSYHRLRQSGPRRWFCKRDSTPKRSTLASC